MNCVLIYCAIVFLQNMLLILLTLLSTPNCMGKQIISDFISNTVIIITGMCLRIM